MNKRVVAIFLFFLVAVATVPTARGSYTVPHGYRRNYGQMCKADLTGDGTPDIVVAFEDAVVITTEQGKYEFDTPGGRDSDVQCANIVGSPLPDAVVVREGRFTVITFTRDGAWEQTDKPVSVGTARALLVGDVDQDGRVDAILGSHDGGAYLLRAVDGEGVFEAPVKFHTTGTSSLAWMDVDGDGEALDIALGTSQGVVVRVNDGNGGFLQAAARASVSDNTIRGMWAGDYDGDGNANDIVVTTWSGYMAHLQVQPNGDVQKVTQQSTGETLWRLAVCDVDRDGKLDILTSEHRAHKVLLASNYEAGVGWSTAEVSTGQNPREIIPTFQTLDDGIMDVLVLHHNGDLQVFSLTGDACPLASPEEWGGSSLPHYLPSISRWELRDSLAMIEVTWEKPVARRTQNAFIKPPSGEEPTCVFGAPQMDVDTCEVTASRAIALGDLMSDVCGLHSRIVNVEANEVYLMWDVVAHTADSMPLQLGNGDVIQHETRFVSQLPIGFTLPNEIDVQFSPLEIHGPAWVTAGLQDVSPTEYTGIVRATYAIHSPADVRMVLDSASNVHAWTWGECEVVDGRCVNTLTVDVSVCTGSKTMVLDFTLFCGDEPCPNGHDSMTTTALITQQEELCEVHLQGIEVRAVTAVAEGQDVAMVGEELTGHTKLTAHDRDGFPVPLEGVDLSAYKLCARETHDASLADPCSQTPHRIFAWEHGESIAGTEDLAVRVDMEQDSEGALLVDITMTLARKNIPSTWVGLNMYAVATLNNFAIGGAKRAVRDSQLPREATVVMHIVLGDAESGDDGDEGSSSDSSSGESTGTTNVGPVAGMGAACGGLVLAVGMFVWHRRRQQQRAPAAATAVQMGAVQA